MSKQIITEAVRALLVEYKKISQQKEQDSGDRRRTTETWQIHGKNINKKGTQRIQFN